MVHKLPTLLLVLAVGVLVFYVTRWFHTPEEPAQEEVSATVLLERVRPVLKLITVEGDLSELYHHKDSWTYNTMVAGLPAFQKRAILRVDARASVGYDLNALAVSANEETRTILLQMPARPKVLALDHEVDYYDISEGMFNHFSPRELSQVSAKAKQMVLDKVPQSDLFAEAERQRDLVVELVRGIAANAGWRLEITPVPQRRLAGAS